MLEDSHKGATKSHFIISEIQDKSMDNRNHDVRVPPLIRVFEDSGVLSGARIIVRWRSL